MGAVLSARNRLGRERPNAAVPTRKACRRVIILGSGIGAVKCGIGHRRGHVCYRYSTTTACSEPAKQWAFFAPFGAKRRIQSLCLPSSLGLAGSKSSCHSASMTTFCVSDGVTVILSASLPRPLGRLLSRQNPQFDLHPSYLALARLGGWVADAPPVY